MHLVIALSCLLLVLGVLERALHMRNVRRAPVRVLVNGTRGKTSVTRLLAAALREAGINTLAKCTGTTAAVILPDGSEQPLARPRGVRLTEQLPVFRLARKLGVQAVVLECMAVRPESQRAVAQMVRPTHVLITNARVDHKEEIGATEAETRRALAFSIPRGAAILSAEPYAGAIPPDAVPLPDGYMDRFAYPVFLENLQLVLTAAKALGVDRETALRGMLKATPDIGMDGPFAFGGCTVINAFAANDALSSAQLLRETEIKQGLSGQPVRVVFNNRKDREYRVDTMMPLIRELGERVRSVTVIGDFAPKVARRFAKKTGLPCAAQAPDGLIQEPGVVLCLGNIKGAGADFIRRLRERRGTECNRLPSG